MMRGNGRKAEVLQKENDLGREIPSKPFERLPQEDFVWQRVSRVRTFKEKPFTCENLGQGGWAWLPTRIDLLGDQGVSPGIGELPEILDAGTYACAFCRGKGERSNRIRCPACGGTGKVKVPVSAVRCAFCKGRGEAKPRTNITCTVCRGTGLVQVSGPIATCPQCRGRGMRAGSDGLPCPRCAGKGFVRGNGTSGERGGLSCR